MESLQQPIPKYKIIAMGQTGAGKSTVLNSFALGLHEPNQKIFREGYEYISVTQECKSIITRFKRRSSAPFIQLMDTPGFMDTGDNDKQNLVKICSALSQLQHGVNLILFCFPATTMKFSADLQVAFRWLGKLLGNDVYQFVRLCITQIDILTEQQKQIQLTKVQTELIPTMKSILNIDISQQIIFYYHGEEDDGLDEIIGELEQSPQTDYKPEIIDIVNQDFDIDNPSQTVDTILKKSKELQEFQQDFYLEKLRKEEQQRKFEEFMIRQGEISQEQLYQFKQIREQQINELKDASNDLEQFKNQWSNQMNLLKQNQSAQFNLTQQNQNECNQSQIIEQKQSLTQQEILIKQQAEMYQKQIEQQKLFYEQRQQEMQNVQVNNQKKDKTQSELIQVLDKIPALLGALSAAQKTECSIF